MAAAGIPPYTEVQLSHPVRVQTPVDAYFSDGRERVRVAAVEAEPFPVVASTMGLVEVGLLVVRPRPTAPD